MVDSKYLKQNGEAFYPVTSADAIPDLFNKIYPVGSIYISTNSTNPNTLFGGTWEQIQNRFLLAAGSSYSAGSTGGAATVTLTTSQIPSHSHYTINTGKTQNISSGSGYTIPVGNTYGNNGNFSTSNTGGGGSHENMPPYLAVYVWKRTG